MNKTAIITICLLTINYTLSAQTSTHNEASGEQIFTSPEYRNNIKRQYNINVTVNAPILLTIKYNIEASYDFIYVYECDDTFSNLNKVAAFDGNNTSTLKTSTPNGKVVIIFDSDGGYNGDNIGPDAGFQINWSIAEETTIPERHTINNTDQILIGEVINNSNIKILDSYTKNLNDNVKPSTDYNKAMLLLESNYGSKLGLSYNKISTNSNFGIASEGNISLYANNYNFSTPGAIDGVRISNTGKILIGDAPNSAAYITTLIDGNPDNLLLWFTTKNFSHRFKLSNYTYFNDKWAPEFSCTVPSSESGPGMIFKVSHSGPMQSDFGIFTFASDKEVSAETKLFDIWNGNKQSYFSFYGNGKFYAKGDIESGGTISATEIKVTAQTADFVFEEDYNLRSLNEVNAFIEQNKHLPDVPSASKMEEEGVNIAEMNKILLQKVEELTLYIIQQNKESISKNKELNLLKREVSEIKELLIKSNYE
ncbi:hypothetical protein [Saccharicrinis aurantiacus]|uniref:hypothetical protein n=1 Tax=Saccharicrinis aurantiacus TaxID=1849719 RepID=UPI0008383D4E|nr:hypothetical protein [Saccharicrinis aurantiacus]